jgi:hypothetical protein
VAVPEEMSVWAGMTAGPEMLRTLTPGEPFNRFCGLLIDAFRTVHRPFQELARLGHGLCPFDWLDVLSVNQVRALRRFLGVIDGREIGDPSAWDAAWAQAPVPGADRPAVNPGTPTDAVRRRQRLLSFFCKDRTRAHDQPPQKWSTGSYGFGFEKGCDGEKETQVRRDRRQAAAG